MHLKNATFFSRWKNNGLAVDVLSNPNSRDLFSQELKKQTIKNMEELGLIFKRLKKEFYSLITHKQFFVLMIILQKALLSFKVIFLRHEWLKSVL